MLARYNPDSPRSIYRPQVVQPPAYQALAYQAPGLKFKLTRDHDSFTSSSPKVMERDTEVTKDTMHPTNNGSTEDVPPPVVPVVNHESISEPANAPVSASRPNQKASIPFPS
ncbi:hypothetical protein Tco_1043495 [Tanacetum coccineum]|uniref:Uncharacterized protein n=1 Tax=Tanacetum coccineum TaxID=301880 RepID=A0ABQ5GNE7_9ASTR